ncbi:unnamed protein product [Closterium sp. Naga37s-1]|nr:unnamed protein product [Closterium sp. Naga37s-1]
MPSNFPYSPAITIIFLQDFRGQFGRTGVRSRGFIIPQFNISFLRMPSNFLVRSSPVGVASSAGAWRVHLDRPDPSWFKLLPHTHYVIFSAGHWFINVSGYVNTGQELHGHAGAGDERHEDAVGREEYGDTASERRTSEGAFELGAELGGGEGGERKNDVVMNGTRMLWAERNTETLQARDAQVKGDERHEDAVGREEYGDTASERRPSKGEGDERHEDAVGREEYGDTASERRPSKGEGDERHEDAVGREEYGDTASERRPSKGEGDERLEDAVGREEYGDTASERRPSKGEGDEWHEDAVGREEYGDTASERRPSKGASGLGVELGGGEGGERKNDVVMNGTRMLWAGKNTKTLQARDAQVKVRLGWVQAHTLFFSCVKMRGGGDGRDADAVAGEEHQDTDAHHSRQSHPSLSQISLTLHLHSRNPISLPYPFAAVLSRHSAPIHNSR